ncbi:MAG TPA: alcohol dehydrogenase catalytic domain-containing protein [Firmicutes bacterium]|nr:alcohol dehydrogenase catalytic domain-containing protein [Bacillota bacterium]
MKAAIYHGPGKMTLEDVERPSIDPAGILVEVRASGVCGTDVKTFLRGHRFFEPPCILGHEFAGVVAEVGSQVKDFAPGDRVAVAPYVPCGFCPMCQGGLFELCYKKSGVSGGAFTQYVSVPKEVLERGTVRLPEGMSFAAGAMAEPLACTLNGLEDCRLKLGDTLLILGAGPMGLLSAQAALAQGVGKVIVSELNEERLSKAREIGAIPVNPKRDNLKALVKRETNGLMAQAVLVCVGFAEAVEEAQAYVAPGGVINMFGGLPKDSTVTVDPGLIHYQQVSLVGSFGFTHVQFRQAVELMAAGRIDAERIVTHTLPLEQAAQGIKLSAEQKALKVMLVNEG